jgi:hypothetical protein
VVDAFFDDFLGDSLTGPFFSASPLAFFLAFASSANFAVFSTALSLQ